MKNGHLWTERNVILGKNTHLFQSCYLGLVSSQHLGNGRLRFEPWHDFGRKLSLQNFKQPETMDSTQLPYFLPPSLLPPSLLPSLPFFFLLSSFPFSFLFSFLRKPIILQSRMMQAGPELAIPHSLASNSRSSCFSPPHVGCRLVLLHPLCYFYTMNLTGISKIILIMIK